MNMIQDCNCGIANTNRNKIYGGQEAQPHEYPWNVYVSMKKNGQWSGMCGGSLISNQHVLTAAHCVDEGLQKKDIRLQLGKIDFLPDDLTNQLLQVHMTRINLRLQLAC